MEIHVDENKKILPKIALPLSITLLSIAIFSNLIFSWGSFSLGNDSTNKTETKVSTEKTNEVATSEGKVAGAKTEEKETKPVESNNKTEEKETNPVVSDNSTSNTTNQGQQTTINTAPVTPTVTTQPKPVLSDNSSKLGVIKNYFKEIGNINVEIARDQLLLDNLGTSYTCNPDKYSQEFLPNGERNSDYVFNPFEADKIYQQCLDGKNNVLKPYVTAIESLKARITEINDKIQDVIATCSGNECNDYYWVFVKEFESKGLIVK